MTYQLLHELLDLIERFDGVSKGIEQSMEGFLHFAQSYKDQSRKDYIPYGKTTNEQHLNAVIARDISLIYRYTRFFVRKAIKNTPLQTIEEFSYLRTVMAHGEISKTELNNYNVIEKTSGGEIIRRLLERKLISQTRSTRDRRSLLLSITPLGKEVLSKVQASMQLGSDLLLAPLTWEQKSILHMIHQRLFAHCQPLFLEYRDSSLSELWEHILEENN